MHAIRPRLCTHAISPRLTRTLSVPASKEHGVQALTRTRCHTVCTSGSSSRLLVLSEVTDRPLSSLVLSRELTERMLSEPNSRAFEGELAARTLCELISREVVVAGLTFWQSNSITGSPTLRARIASSI
eukprot:746130-Rhodomonas_salina.1